MPAQLPSLSRNLLSLLNIMEIHRFSKFFCATIAIILLYILFSYANSDKDDKENPTKLQPYSSEISNYIEEIRRDCGDLCNTSRSGTKGPFFDHIKAKINCEPLFANDFIDRGHGFAHAPGEIPNELMKDFTMNFQLKVRKKYFDNNFVEAAKTPIWTFDEIEKKLEEARYGKLRGTYGKDETNALRDGLKHAEGINNGRVLVIGSRDPWVEVCVLEAGARQIVTLEYGSILSQHPRIKTLVPAEFREKYLNKTLGLFDAVVTYSSVEHSGLGRYGDALNPWGDIIAIARGWCVTREEGSLTVGVMYTRGYDYIRFNADRNYGKIRYPYLTTNWKQKYMGKGRQRVHVFTKTNI